MCYNELNIELVLKGSVSQGSPVPVHNIADSGTCDGSPRDGQINQKRNKVSLKISLTVGCGKTTSCISFSVSSCSMAIQAP